MSNAGSRLAIKGAKRLLVTSDVPFTGKSEQDGNGSFSLDNIVGAQPTSDLANFLSSNLGKSNGAITPPDQQIPAETSPRKLATPRAQAQAFPSINQGGSSTYSSDVASRLKESNNRMRLKRFK